MTYDLAIIGGGPAGLATAIEAQLAGLRCVVFERRGPPFDKACGEGIMPAGVNALGRLGVTLPARRFRLRGISFIDGERRATASFGDATALGIRRTDLIAALSQRARELGAVVHHDEPVTHWQENAQTVEVRTPSRSLSATLLVGADGLHSRVRRDATIHTRPVGLERYGVRRHYAIPPWSDTVEVYFHDNVQAFVTPVADDLVGVAMLWHGEKAHYDSLLRRFPELEHRLSRATVMSTDLGAGPFAQRVARRTLGRVALVGDAAGYLDPISGEGLSLASGCARELVAVVRRGDALRSYEPAYHRVSRTYWFMTGLLLQLAQHPTLRRYALLALSRAPKLFDTLLALNGGALRSRKSTYFAAAPTPPV